MLAASEEQVMRNAGRFFYGWVVAIAAFVFMIAVWGAYYSFGVYFKPVSGDFGWSRAVTAGAFSTYMVLHGFIAIFAGRFTDKYGPRLVMTACALLLALGYGLMSQISSLWQLYLFFGVIIGVGMSGAYVPPISAVARWFEKDRGLMLGFVICGVGIGTVLFPPIATFIITAYSWRVAYLLTGAAILVLGVSSAFFLKRAPRDMGLLPYGAAAGKKIEFGAKADIKAPFCPEFSTREALRTTVFWQLFFSYSLCLVCLDMIMVHLVPHATDIGITATIAALFLSLIGVGSIVGRILGGFISDRIGAKINIALWAIIQGLSVLSLLVIREPWMFYVFAAVFGLGYGGWVPAFPAIIGELFGMKAHGGIFGVILFAATIGGAAGSLIAGFIYDVTQSYASAFLTAGVAVSLGGVIALTIRQPREKTAPAPGMVPAGEVAGKLTNK